jgi:beta-glucanase (GH16 family)
VTAAAPDAAPSTALMTSEGQTVNALTVAFLALIAPTLLLVADQRPADAVPTGPPGNWVLAFRDEFNATTLDTSKWNNGGKHQNDVWNAPRNAWLHNGKAALNLSSRTTGAMLYSGPVDGIGADHYQLPVGGYVEARVRLPGPGATPGPSLHNWGAWWTVGTDSWPVEGEIDIAESAAWRTSNQLSANYHSPTAHIGYYVPGNWSNAYHVYAAHRRTDAVDFYYDGHLIKTLPTSDNGEPHSLVFNHGLMEGQKPVLGGAARIRIDWVRAWEQP